MPVAGLVVLAVYALTLPFGFVGDDRLLFEKNPFLAPGSSVFELWTRNLWSASGAHLAAPYYRPLPMSLAWLDSRLFGLTPSSLRAVNLLAHAATAEVLERLLRRRLGVERRGLALCLALVFALHPLSTEHVVWLSGRFDGLAMLFVALGLLENGTRRAASTVPLCVLGALLSKETGFVLPCAIAASDWVERRPFALAKWLGIAGAMLSFVLLRQAAGVGWTSTSQPLHASSALSGFAELILIYGRLFLVPIGLDLYHPSHPPPFVGSLAVSALVVTAVAGGFRLARTRRRPEIAAALVLLVCPLALASGVGPTQRVFGDRFAALPSFGLVLLFGATDLPRFLSKGRNLGISFVVVALLGLVAVDRALYFRDDETLRRAALRRTPDHFYWLTIEGLRALERGDLAVAQTSFERAERLAPGFGKASGGLCAVELGRGRAAEAEAACRRSVAASPRNFSTWTNLASALLTQGKSSDALDATTRALALRPESIEALYLRALSLDRLGRSKDALGTARRVLELSPTHAGASRLAVEIPRRRKSPAPTKSP